MSGFTSAYLGNPTSTLTRPGDTTAYAQNDLIASSATAANVAVPSILAARYSQSGGTIIRARLSTNATTGWDASTFSINLWSAAPTYTNGDNGAYAVATGAAYHIGKITLTLSQAADGAYGEGVPNVGNGIVFFLTGVTTPRLLYWDLQYTAAAALTPIASQTFTLTLEVIQE